MKLKLIGPVSLVYFHFRFTTSGYIGGICSIWSSAMPFDVLIELEEIRHSVCFDFRQTRRNEKNGSNDAGLLIFKIKNTVCECYF